MKEIKERQFAVEKMDWLLKNPYAIEVLNALPTTQSKREAFLERYKLAQKHRKEGRFQP